MASPSDIDMESQKESENKINRIEEVKDQEDHESNSDSDKLTDGPESTINSWVFVNSKVTEEKEDSDITNKFYLDCSEEPVQELHEHDLNIHQSGSDSDTDGISVISETDPFKHDDENMPAESLENEEEIVKSEHDNELYKETPSVTREITRTDREAPTTTQNKPPLTFNQVSYIIAFIVVLVLVPLHWYFSPNFDKKEIETPEEILNSLSKRKIDSQRQNDYTTDHVIIDDPLTYCTKIYEDSDPMYKTRNIKKCLRKLEKAKEKFNRINRNLYDMIPEIDEHTEQENIEEIHLNYKAEYSKMDNNENKHEVYSKKVRYRKPHENKERKHEKEYKVIKNTTNDESRAYRFEYHSKNASQINQTDIHQKHIAKEDDEAVYKKHLEFENKLKAKEKYLFEKEQYLERKEKELKRRDLKKSSDEHQKKAKFNKKSREAESDNSENSVETDASYLENKKSKEYLKHEKQNKKKHSKTRDKASQDDDLSSEHKNDRPHYDKTNKNEKDKNKRHTKNKNKYSIESDTDYNKDEDWYNELFEARSRLRKKNDLDSSNDDYDTDKSGSENKKKEKGKIKHHEGERVKNGQWYSKLFESREKMRKTSDGDFMKDDNFQNEYKFYSNRYRRESFDF